MPLLKLLIAVALATLAVPVLAGLMGAMHPALDSLAHFRLHLTVLLALGLGVTWWMNDRWVRLSAAAVIVLALAATLPHLPGLDRLTSAKAEGEKLTIVQLNLRFDNEDTDRALTAIQEHPSDFVLLQEVTATTEPVLKALKASHPFQLSCRFASVGSVAIASRHPFVSTVMQKCIRAYGFASARFSVDGHELTVGSFHSYWPWPFRQSEQISMLSEHFEQMASPVLIAGDFNAAPWSHAVKRVAKLSNTEAAGGLISTWSPSLGNWRLPRPFGLTIDNTLFSEELSLKRRWAGEEAGSDHLPIFTEFQWVSPATNRSANVSSNLALSIFPVDDAGKASVTIMRDGRL